MPPEPTEENVSGSDVFSSWFKILGAGNTPFTLHISGTWVGTVTFQMRRIDSANIVDLDTFSANDVKNGEANGSWEVRAGFKSGAWTSGTAIIAFSQ